MATESWLDRVGGLAVPDKIEWLQRHYQQCIFSPNGIIYALLRVDDSGVRPHVEADLGDGQYIDISKWAVQPDGQHNLLNYENAITNSGLYLAAQSIRYRVTQDAAAKEQADRAFRSLTTIYQFGLDAGRPGWMGKPYGGCYSEHTSGDQYIHACLGLWEYLTIADDTTITKATMMLVGFADYWRSVDYSITYLGTRCNLGNQPGTYNNVAMVLVNALAWWVTRKDDYRDEATRLLQGAVWPDRNCVEYWRDCWRRDDPNMAGPLRKDFADELAGEALKPGETVAWEQLTHDAFFAIGCEIFATVIPELLDYDTSTTMVRWWTLKSYGVGDDLLPYYYAIINLDDDSWRPPSHTVPHSEAMCPFWSYLSTVRFTCRLARLLYASTATAIAVDDVRSEATAFANRILQAMDGTRLHWVHDPDQQLSPRTAYMAHVLDSEVASTVLLCYWKGKEKNLW